MKRIFVIILPLLICLVPMWAWGGTYYVSYGATGNWADATNRSTPTSYVTANAYAVAGDTVIYINDGGTFAESLTIWPSNNGTSGNRITFKGEDGTTVTIASPSSGASVFLRGNSYINIENFTVTGTDRSRWIDMQGGIEPTPVETHHITISDNIFLPYSDIWGGIEMNGDVNNIVIRNNTITGGTGATKGPADLIYAVAEVDSVGYTIDHILIEGNTISGGYHNAVGFQELSGTIEKCVIRNNNISNPNHTSLNIYTNSSQFLVENNVISDAGSICEDDEDNSDCQENVWGSTGDRANPRWMHPGIQLGAFYTIIRNNVIVNNGTGLIMPSYGASQLSQHNRVYNNTFDDNIRALENNSTAASYDHKMKNNIFHDSSEYAVYRSLSGSPTDNYWFFNDFYSTSDVRSGYSVDSCADADFACLEANHSDEWSDNLLVDPLFENDAGHNYILTNSSPLIDAGTALTSVHADDTSSGTSLVVEDSRYFQDGSWALAGEVFADFICVTTVNNCVQISSIDYSTNTITLASGILRSDGDDVWLYKDSDGTIVLTGAAPDIGAREWSAPLPPSNLR